MVAVLVLFILSCAIPPGVQVSGDLLVWHPLSLTVTGPQTSETSEPNPFLDYRMTVSFASESGRQFKMPGFFAADGNAAESGAESGNRWRVVWTPDESGVWHYRVSLLSGPRIALNPDQKGVSAPGDGLEGDIIVVDPSDGQSDPLAPGRLRYNGHHYLQYSGNHRYYLKAGTDSPENFLAYDEFDSSRPNLPTESPQREGEAARVPLHHYGPHIADWKPGDPTWKNGLGKGIIGALNYLSEQGVNSVYFLTMNIDGDGDDVWPYRTRTDRYRFDCSKLDQWDRVFDHMDRLGIALHVVLTETENESLFESEEGGDFADSRKLYYRELIARFAHHAGVVWNLGEENGWNNDGWDADAPQTRGNTTLQRKQFAAYIRLLDPYDNPIVVHTLPGDYERIYEPLLGFKSFEGPSLQIADMRQTHAQTLQWVLRSEASGRPWFVCLDEIGPADTGVLPDADDPQHNQVRRFALWGNLMAGGAGCEWYFGYKYPNNDLDLEDFRSRQNMWTQTRIAVRFFQDHLPFVQMKSADELIRGGDGYCFAELGKIYAVYLPTGESTRLWLPKATYRIRWFDPLHGGDLQPGSRTTAKGQGFEALGQPPDNSKHDWVVLVELDGAAPAKVAAPPQ